MIETLPLAAAAAFGAVVGILLNACIHRLPLGKSDAAIDAGRRGGCRAALGPLSIRYALVELATAAMFALAWRYYGPGPLLASRLLFGCALIVLFAIDLEHHLLPNAITLPGIVVGFLFSFATDPGWLASFVGIVLGGGTLFLVAEAYYRWRHEEGLGMGDVKMLAMIGAFIGWKLTLVALMLASVIGSVIGVALLASGRGGMKYALPFGAFLALGAAAAGTIGSAWLDWYLRMW